MTPVQIHSDIQTIQVGLHIHFAEYNKMGMSKQEVIEKMRTAAWDGTYKELCADGAYFIHGGSCMPIDAFLGWCSAVGSAKAFPDWKWTNTFVEEQKDGSLKIGSQQTTGK